LGITCPVLLKKVAPNCKTMPEERETIIFNDNIIVYLKGLSYDELVSKSKPKSKGDHEMVLQATHLIPIRVGKSIRQVKRKNIISFTESKPLADGRVMLSFYQNGINNKELLVKLQKQTNNGEH